jgi:translocation and assembly module TamB
MSAGAGGAGGGAGGSGPSEPRRGRRGRLRGCLGGALRLAAWALAALALLIAAAAWLLRSDHAAERGRRLLEEQLSATLGREVTAGRIEAGAWPLSLTVHGLVVPSPDPADPPFAFVPEAEIQLDVSGFRRPRIHVRRVFVRGPEIRLILGEDGASNLPDFRGGEGDGRVEVTVGSLVVRDGILHLDERTLPLELEAGPLQARFEGTGSAGEPRYEGRLAAQEVRIVLPDAEPYRGGLTARAAVERGRVEIVELRFAAPEVVARAAGEVTWDDLSRRVDLELEADARAELFNRLGYSDEPLTGPLEVGGRFQWTVPVAAADEAVDGGGEWAFTGEVGSERLAALGLTFEDAAAGLTVDATGVAVEIDRARYAGGRIAGTVTVPSTAGEAGRGGESAKAPTRVETDLRFEGLALSRVLADQGLELGAITGSLSGDAEYDFTTDAPAGGNGRVRASLAGLRRGPVKRGADDLPLDGEAELTIRAGVVGTEGAVITAPGQRLIASGSYDLEASRGRFDYRLESTDLAPLYRALPLAAEPPAAEETTEPEPWRVTAGSGSAEGVLTLRPEGLELTAALDLEDVRTPDLAFDALTGALRLTPEAVRDLRLEATRGEGALIATGTVPLAEGAGAPALDLAFDLAAWPLDELAPLLPEGTPELAGAVSGWVELEGSFEALAGRAELAAAPLAVAGFEVERAEAAGGFGPERLWLDRLVAGLPAGTLNASGSLERASGAIEASVEALELHLGAPPFAGLVPGGLRGTVSLGAAATGTLDRPEAQLTVAGTGLSLAGRELGEAGTAETTLLWSGGRVTAEGSLLGLIRFEGGGELELPRNGAGGEVDLELALAADDLRSLAQLAAERPLPDFDGSLRGTLSVRGDPAKPAELTVALRLPEVAIAFEGLEIENLEPVTATLAGGTVRLESLYLGQPGTADELFVAGTADLAVDGVPLDLDFQGSLDAGWLEAVVPGSALAGTLAVLGSVRGPAAAPRVVGQGEVEGGRAILPGFPHALESIAATVFFEPGEVILDSLAAELAGGDVRAQGRIALAVGDAAPAAGPDYRFQARARGFTLRWPEGFVLRGGADLSLLSAGEERQISGVVELDRIFYLQDVTVSLTRLLQEALQRRRLEAGEGDSELASTQLAVAVRGPLRVRNNIADLDGRAELVVRGTLAAPAVFGQVTMEPGGTVTYADTVYSVERGLLTFSNPLRIDPVIDVVATTEVDDYDVTLQLSGTLDRLDASFTSDPPLADLEVLQLLATGSAPGADSGSGLFPGAGEGNDLQGGAAALLYGQAASLVTERVNTLFGFDRFRVSPGIGGAVGFAVGKRLSRDFYITVSNDPINDIDYVVQAEWRVSDWVTVVLTQRGEEAFAVDLRWEKRF